MEPEGSLPRLQAPATYPYPEPDQSSPCPPSYFYLIWVSRLRPGLSSGLFTSGFPTKTLCAPLHSHTRATFPVHLILLDFIALIMFLEEYIFRKNVDLNCTAAKT
jgi:hypothetical protein